MTERFPRSEPRAGEWLIWQLADSAFPTGGFAHSGGLEAAWQNGEVRNRAELASFICAALNQTGHGSLPFMTAAHQSGERLAEIDRLCDCFLSNHVANRASRLQGRAFLASANRIFSSTAMIEPPCSHMAPVFGAVTHELGVDAGTTGRLFLFFQLRGLIGAAVRLGIVGPMEAQALQCELSQHAETTLEECRELTLDEVAQTAPLIELWQGTQDRLYSRLFQS